MNARLTRDQITRRALRAATAVAVGGFAPACATMDVAVVGSDDAAALDGTVDAAEIDVQAADATDAPRWPVGIGGSGGDAAAGDDVAAQTDDGATAGDDTAASGDDTAAASGDTAAASDDTAAAGDDALATADSDATDAAEADACVDTGDWEAYAACCDANGWDFHKGCMAWGPPPPPTMHAAALEGLLDELRAMAPALTEVA